MPLCSHVTVGMEGQHAMLSFCDNCSHGGEVPKIGSAPLGERLHYIRIEWFKTGQNRALILYPFNLRTYTGLMCF